MSSGCTGGFTGNIAPDDFGHFKTQPGVRKQAESLVKRDIELYKKLKLTAVPAIIIKGRVIEGNPGREVLESVIEREMNSSR